KTAPSSTTAARPRSTPVTTYRPRTSDDAMEPRPASGARGGGGGEPAGARAAAGGAPEHLEAVGERPAVGRRQPEPHEQSIAAGFGRVLVGGPAVVDDVVVQELDVARFEHHLVPVLVAHRGEQVECLVLRGSEARDPRHLLRGLHEGARVLGRELAVAHREDRQRVAGGLAARLLALPAPVV